MFPVEIKGGLGVYQWKGSSGSSFLSSHFSMDGSCKSFWNLALQKWQIQDDFSFPSTWTSTIFRYRQLGHIHSRYLWMVLFRGSARPLTFFSLALIPTYPSQFSKAFWLYAVLLIRNLSAERLLWLFGQTIRTRFLPKRSHNILEEFLNYSICSNSKDAQTLIFHPFPYKENFWFRIDAFQSNGLQLHKLNFRDCVHKSRTLSFFIFHPVKNFLLLGPCFLRYLVWISRIAFTT